MGLFLRTLRNWLTSRKSKKCKNISKSCKNQFNSVASSESNLNLLKLKKQNKPYSNRQGKAQRQ
jgi:hypothetical protein